MMARPVEAAAIGTPHTRVSAFIDPIDYSHCIRRLHAMGIVRAGRGNPGTSGLAVAMRLRRWRLFADREGFPAGGLGAGTQRLGCSAMRLGRCSRPRRTSEQAPPECTRVAGVRPVHLVPAPQVPAQAVTRGADATLSSCHTAARREFLARELTGPTLKRANVLHGSRLASTPAHAESMTEVTSSFDVLFSGSKLWGQGIWWAQQDLNL